jgi:hypothetical protein
MRRLLLMMVFAVTLLASAFAQEETEPPAEDTESAEVSQPTEDADEADDPVVDDEFYQDADDEDFRPSEDIPADQSIPYPTDI